MKAIVVMIVALVLAGCSPRISAEVAYVDLVSGEETYRGRPRDVGHPPGRDRWIIYRDGVAPLVIRGSECTYPEVDAQRTAEVNAWLERGG